jgi:capsular polysaccharide transport system permease protein
VLTLLYLLFFAQATYQAEVKLIVRENKETASSLIPGLAASLLGTGSQISVEDAYILSAYLHGSQFIDLADRRLGLKAHFQHPVLDPLHRLKKAPEAEEFYDYVRDHISINIAGDSNIVTIYTKAFSPRMAQDLANLVIEESEKAINILNVRMTDSKTALANKELAHRQANLLNKRQELLAFQTAHNMLNPTSEAGSHLAMLATLDGKLIEKKTELRTKEQYLQPDSFEIKSIQQAIKALDSQRQQETGTLVAPGDKNMAATLLAYEDLRMQAEFAQQAYASAFALVESATLEAGRQEKFLLLIEPAHLPEHPIFPEPAEGTIIAFITATVLFAIARLVAATIRDHSI